MAKYVKMGTQNKVLFFPYKSSSNLKTICINLKNIQLATFVYNQIVYLCSNKYDWKQYLGQKIVKTQW